MSRVAHRRLDVDESVVERVRAWEIAEVFGVSRRIARRLWEEFGDVDRLRETSRKELQQVDGVGPATAERIRPPEDARVLYRRERP